MFKSLIGSVVGAAIGLGLHYGIKQSTGESYIWFPVIIGALTGIVGRIVAGQATSNAARYGAGLFAGLIALAAIFGIDFIDSAMTNVEEFGPLPDRVTEAVKPAPKDAETEGVEEGSSDKADDAQGSADKTTAAETEGEQGSNEKANDSDNESTEASSSSAGNSDARNDRRRADPPTGLGNQNSAAAQERFAELISKHKKDSWYDLYMPYIFSGIGVLMAYQLARGFGSTPKES